MLFAEQETKAIYDAQLLKFSPLKRQLQIDGGIPSSDQLISTQNFNELEVLQLIPVIIKQLKENAMAASDQQILTVIFGDLWQLIDEEATRPRNEPINPVLKALLHAQELHWNRRQMRQSQFHNDFEHNTVDKIVRKGHFKRTDKIPKSLAKVKTLDHIAPSQRLLKVAALLIHKTIMRKQNQVQKKNTGVEEPNSIRKLRIHKKQLANGDFGKDVEPVLEVQLETVAASQGSRRSRQKRHIQYAEDEDDSINEVEMNALRSLIMPEDADDSEEGYFEDYDNNDGGKPTYAATQKVNQEYMDYAFDVSDTDTNNEEEQMLRAYYAPRTLSPSFDDSDYGSISELMQLAAKHHFRAQRDSGYLKRLHFDDYEVDY